MKSQTFSNKEHEFITKDGHITSAIDYKFPWYDNEGKILGIFGMVIAYSGYTAIHPMKPSLDFITNILARLNNRTFKPLSYEIANIKLTRREKDCVEFLLKGLSAKMIATNLDLSPRTVEYYLENIKAKFDVSTKAALVAKILDYHHDETC